MDVYIAVDVGGSQLRVAVFPTEGLKPLVQKKILTRGKASALDRLKGLISEVWKPEYRVRAIGITAPGPVDAATGVVYCAPNIPDWVNLPLSQDLQEYFNVPVAVGNDANLAALAEWKFGAGRGHHDLVYVTISTGIGGGVITNDKLLLGRHGLAAELGHVMVDPNGPMCSCGQRGHLEAISSGTAIAQYVKQKLAEKVHSSLSQYPSPSSADVAREAAQGDSLAIEAYNRAGTFLGRVIVNYLHIFNPSIVIMGGGVTSSGPLFFEPIQSVLSDYVLSPVYLKDLIITRASLGDDAGLLGALALVYTNKN